jgi:glucose-6-phosphate dehydrogenase assembly protein OpcA
MIRLEDTSGGAVAAAIASERHRLGSPATGMVLTLIILANEEFQSDATAGAVSAAREHPMRIVTLIPRPGRMQASLDAEIAVGGEDGPGELAVLRLRGELSNHANSVAIPLLLSDTPVVAFWPTSPPAIPVEDPIGKHAQLRITDCATSQNPQAELRNRFEGYTPGDVDLSWTRLTPWRSALAAAFDNVLVQVNDINILADSNNPSALLLKSWLQLRLHCDASIVHTPGSELSSVSIITHQGDISLTRLNSNQAILNKPGVPTATIGLPERDLAALLNEELKYLNPDETYGAVLSAFGNT